MCVDSVESAIAADGQKNSFTEGKDLLKELLVKAGDDVVIMVGAGVSPETLDTAGREICAPAYHMSGKIIKDSAMTYRKEGVSMGLPGLNESEIWQTDTNKVHEARAILDTF